MTDEEDCEFRRFDQDLFCKVAKDKTIAFIGDSISLDHYMSVTHLLGEPRRVPGARFRNVQITSTVCNGTVTLIGQRDFYLQLIGSVVENHDPDVLVLNRGAHYTPDDQLLNDLHTRIIPDVHRWYANCTRRLLSKQKDCALIWRTSVPGHPDCLNVTLPTTSVTAMEQHLQQSSDPHHWTQFAHQNQLVVRDVLLQQPPQDSNHPRLPWTIMDAYRFNILRPDLHKGGDCLHTCAPGDELYSELLLHMMRQKYSPPLENNAKEDGHDGING